MDRIILLLTMVDNFAYNFSLYFLYCRCFATWEQLREMQSTMGKEMDFFGGKCDYTLLTRIVEIEQSMEIGFMFKHIWIEKVFATNLGKCAENGNKRIVN